MPEFAESQQGVQSVADPTPALFRNGGPTDDGPVGGPGPTHPNAAPRLGSIAANHSVPSDIDPGCPRPRKRRRPVLAVDKVAAEAKRARDDLRIYSTARLTLSHNSSRDRLADIRHKSHDSERGGVHTPLIVKPASTSESEPHQRTYPYSFLDFPAEIRNQIYDSLAVYPTSAALYSSYNRAIDEFYSRRRRGYQEPFPKCPAPTCPAVLLLCRQITAECLPILKSCPFIVDNLPPWIPGQNRPMLVSNFISKQTIQNLKFIELRIALGKGTMGSGWAWKTIAMDVFTLLQRMNQFVGLRVVVSIFQDQSPHVLAEELQVALDLHSTLNELRNHNPKIWRPGKVDEEYWVVREKTATQVLFRVWEDTGHLDVLIAENPKTRRYPDPVIWTSSIMDFI
ncbi:hypothetical protein GQ53DRAFT_379670 [Thozetella sp. PMI_491]|nr:hypothetical protein GQ53DRAFT_379670 [Thozetella sp. PMI_491]